MCQCPYYDALLTRSAVLTLTLRKIALEAHRQGGHGGTWERCALWPCQDAAKAVRDAGDSEDAGA